MKHMSNELEVVDEEDRSDEESKGKIDVVFA